MKVRELIKELCEVDPELEVTTCVSPDCFISDREYTYGIDPTFSVEKLYEYRETIYTDESDVIELIAEDLDIDDTDVEDVEKAFLQVPVSEKLVITVSP